MCIFPKKKKNVVMFRGEGKKGKGFSSPEKKKKPGKKEGGKG